MEIQYKIEKSQRKEMAHNIANLIGYDCSYTGAPDFNYKIGDFTLTPTGLLEFSDITDSELAEKLIDGLSELGYETEQSKTALTVQMPIDFFTEQIFVNLNQLIENKHELFCHAFGTDNLEYEINEETVEFPWFTIEQDRDADAYCKFISALCDMAKNQKRINNKSDTSDNEKYTFRCFLIRLGFVGQEYKDVRKILLRNLSGSSAFRNGVSKNA